MQEYVIRKETMTLIADRLRVLVGKTTPLTPAEIAYYLEKVVFTPQSWATSEFSLNFDTISSGEMPTIYEGVAASEFSLNFDTTVIGEIQEEI